MLSSRTSTPFGIVAAGAALTLLAGIPAQATPVAPTSEPTSTPTATATPSPTPTPTAAPLPPTLRSGSKGGDVKRLQSRLNQLRLHDDHITNTFDADTRAAVVAFQKKYKLKGTRGVAGKRVWTKLLEVTRTPTLNELRNIYKPGKTLMKKGLKSKKVRDLEARLKQRKHFSGKVGATYDAKTVKAVRRFQKKTKLPITGKVDARTRDRLAKVTRKPNRTELYNLTVKGPRLAEGCKTGRVLCIDKTSRSLRWVVNGVVKSRTDVRFGDPSKYPTREGQFQVFWKSRDHVSSLYDSPMPYAMFFSGGQAVHYSSDFRARGYSGASHGCVNVRDLAYIKRLFDTVKTGDKVVVYRS